MFNHLVLNNPNITTGVTGSGRKVNKREKERLYQQLFPSYVSSIDYFIYFINELTSQEEIQYLIHDAARVINFVLDTESDRGSNDPALIQILFLHPTAEQSPMLIVEMCHLPLPQSVLFSQIQQLFENIFRADSHLYMWGCLLKELKPFLCFNIFHFPLHSFLHNVQTVFGDWFNDWLKSCSSINDDPIDNDKDSIVIHAPVIDPELLLPANIINNIKINNKELWSLQDSIIYLFSRYLSKRETLQKWSIGLDPRRYDLTYGISIQHQQRITIYAINDCLSLAEVFVLMVQSELKTALTCIKYLPEIDGYRIISDFSFFYFSFQVDSDQELDALCESSDQTGMVHELHEPSPLHQSVGSTQQLENEEPLNNVNQRVNRCRRSLAAQKRRNQKANLRHRRKRYRFEVIRKVNMAIHDVKTILNEYHIQSENINIVNSTLYIDLKNEGLQDFYDRLLPNDLFI